MIRLTALALAATFLLAGPHPAEAKSKKKYVPAYEQYLIPFTCGNNVADTSGALPGDYAIAIDVLNAGTSDVTLSEQVQLTFPPGGQMPSHVSDVLSVPVMAGSAIQISCDDLMGSFSYQNPPAASTYVQGLLSVMASGPVHVTATRTSQGPVGDLSMQTETVEPVATGGKSKIAVCHAPPGNPANAHTINVGMSAWPAHQGHGDTLGACLP